MLGYHPLSAAPISSSGSDETIITPIPSLISVLTPETAVPPTPVRNTLEIEPFVIKSPGVYGSEEPPFI